MDMCKCGCERTADPLVAAETELAAAKQRVDALRRRHDSTAREHNARRLHATLPPELLLTVARYVVAANPRAAPRLAAICTSFRDIIYASPDLWQRIHIVHSDPDPAHIARVYVQRSAGRPLAISLHLFADDRTDDGERDVATLYERLSEARDAIGRARSHPAPDDWPPQLEAALRELEAFKTRTTAAADWDTSLAHAMHILFAEFARCVYFDFRSTRRRPTELVADHIQAARAPILRELTLHLDHTCRLPPIAPCHAPLLVRADIQGAVATPVPQFRGLRRLRIVNGTVDAPSVPLAPLLALLRANPDLEDLRLQPLIPFPVLSTAAPPLCLPKLTRLHLIHNVRLERLMHLLHLPALSELTLVLQAGSKYASLRPIFHGTPYPALHTLHLANLFVHPSATDLTAALRQLTTIRNLSITDSTLADSVLRTLADPTCCPLLEELTFDRCDGIAHDTIIEIWRKRGGGQPSLEPSRPPDYRRSHSSSSSSSVDIQLYGPGRGTLRSLMVRNSSAPLADMQLGEGVLHA